MSDSTGAPDLDRVVEIESVGGDGTRSSRGTGYAIAPGVVLTAAHVVREALTRPHDVRVRQASRTRDEDWATASSVVLAATAGLDVAVVLLPEEWGAGAPQPAARLDIAAPVPFHACGFPHASRADEGGDAEARRGVETARGTVQPAVREALLLLDVQSATPAPRPRSADGQARTGWAGLSGAALFGPDHSFLGVVVRTNVRYAGVRLHAVPVDRLLEDAAISPHLPASWRDDGPRRVSHHVTLRVGSRYRFRLRSPQRRSWPAGSPRRSPATLLAAAFEVVPYIPRREPQRWLEEWCADEQEVSYAVLSGDGGAGKSRLAAELCALMADQGWVSGVADPVSAGQGGQDDVLAADLGSSLLLVLDYADHQQRDVEQLLTGTVAAGSRKVRILALVRDGAAFARRLAAELGQGDEEAAARRQLSLADAGLPLAERELHYRTARTHFAAALGLGTPPDPGERAMESAAAALPTPLLVHARALLDLLEDVPDGPPPDSAAGTTPAGSTAADAIEAGTPARGASEQVLSALLRREDRRFWKAGFEDLLPSWRARYAVFAVSTLVGARSEAEAVGALVGAAPLRGWTEERRYELVERMRDLYGGRQLPVVEPDLLGEQLISETLIAEDALVRVLDHAASAGQRSHALEVLLRMCGSPVGSVGPRARAALDALLRQRVGELVEQAATAGPSDAHASPDALSLPSRLASAFDEVAFVWTPSAAQRAIDRLPSGSVFQPLAAAIYHSASRASATTASYAEAAVLEAKAATALTAAGRPDDAQGPLQQAHVYLAMAPSHVANQTLARILSAGSIVNTATSRTRVAVSDALRAVEIAEGITRDGSGAHDDLLLESRYSLALAYGAATRYPEATATARLACEEIGAADSDTRLRVRALYAYMLFAGGDVEQAIAVVTEGVEQIETAGARSEEANLARLLLTQAVYLTILSRLDEAQRCFLRAERISESLAASGDELMLLLRAQVKLSGATVAATSEDSDTAELLAQQGSDGLYTLYTLSPDVYGPMYALAEGTYSRTLTAAGHVDDALQAAQRGIDATWRGFADRPAAFLTCLVELTVALANAYAADDAWDKAAEAVDQVYARIRRLDPVVVPEAGQACAYLLRCLTDIEIAAGTSDRGVSTARRAVDAYADLARGTDFPGYLLLLIGARLLLVQALSTADRDNEAIAEADLALADAERLVGLAPNDQTRRVLAQARVLVAEGHRFRGDSVSAVAFLRQALDEFVLDHETAVDRNDREILRQTIHEIEFPDEHAADDSTPPEGMADLTPGQHRVVLGRWRDSEIAARAFRPVLVLGPQRSRKTTGLVIPTLLEWQGPALVTSVRSDVAMATIAHRSRFGRTWVFEPTGELFSGGSAVTTWNPLEGCERFDHAVAMAHALTESAHTGAQMERDRFWFDQASLLIQPLLHAAALSRMTMEAVSRWLRTEARAEVQARLLLSPFPEAEQLFQAFSVMADVTRSGVYATARSVLRAYESGAVRRASRTGFSVQDFLDGPNTLYLCAPPEEQEMLAPIFTALVRNVINEAYRRQGGHPDLLLLLDEAGNIAPVEHLDTIATTAAGTGIQLVTVFHDFAQLTATYGEATAQSIVNNHSALLVLPGNRDPRTMDLVDRILADEAAGMRRRRSVRQLKPGTAICVYEHLPVEDIVLRSSTYDPQLLAISRSQLRDDGSDPTADLLVERR
ncbi:type IV secretory system conjugative DNA transfer family protein [Streptomyces polygonati]|uniref:Type IV secretory system conjugative DNA transfer family protein n=1 Tax=Streptomyces polygonati TaxID=1617087 RepID=A0ABV8HCP1_9ACTN